MQTDEPARSKEEIKTPTLRSSVALASFSSRVFSEVLRFLRRVSGTAICCKKGRAKVKRRRCQNSARRDVPPPSGREEPSVLLERRDIPRQWGQWSREPFSDEVKWALEEEGEGTQGDVGEGGAKRATTTRWAGTQER